MFFCPGERTRSSPVPPRNHHKARDSDQGTVPHKRAATDGGGAETAETVAVRRLTTNEHPSDRNGEQEEQRDRSSRSPRRRVDEQQAESDRELRERKQEPSRPCEPVRDRNARGSGETGRDQRAWQKLPQQKRPPAPNARSGARDSCARPPSHGRSLFVGVPRWLSTLWHRAESGRRRFTIGIAGRPGRIRVGRPRRSTAGLASRRPPESELAPRHAYERFGMRSRVRVPPTDQPACRRLSSSVSIGPQSSPARRGILHVRRR